MSDVTRSTMPAGKPGMTFKDHAKELLARFPGVDHGDLLVEVTAEYLMAFKYGNKREERAACDYLNGLQEIAAAQLRAKKEGK